MIRYIDAFMLAISEDQAVVQPTVAAPPANLWPHEIPAKAKAILAEAEEFELLSIYFPYTHGKNSKDSFHGWKILGNTTIKKSETRKELLGAFEKGVAECKARGPAWCFEPRHGIRVASKSHTVDFVICFECNLVLVSVDGEKGQGFLVSHSPADVFNKVLSDAGVELAPAPPAHIKPDPAADVGVGHEKTWSGGETASAKLEPSVLRIQEPVSVAGPTPKLIRKAKVGDVIQLQVSYPVSPPFPFEATVKVFSRALTAILVIRTDGQVGVLRPKPHTNGLGNNYVSAYLRANSPGPAKAVVTLVYPDRTKKEIPFAFEIDDADSGKRGPGNGGVPVKGNPAQAGGPGDGPHPSAPPRKPK